MTQNRNSAVFFDFDCSQCVVLKRSIIFDSNWASFAERAPQLPKLIGRLQLYGHSDKNPGKKVESRLQIEDFNATS